jgi:hypothetical protein
MGAIFDTVVRFFEEEEWSFTQREDQSLIQLMFQGDNGQWSCYAQAREDLAQLVFYSVCPVNVPEDKRLVVSEFLTRVNSNLLMGSFEMDFDDGQVRFRTGIAIGEMGLSTGLVEPLVHANLLLMDLCLPHLMTVLYGNATPLEAIVNMESS